MKRTHKRIFGLFGLVLVAAVTIFAAFLPSPGTLAAEEVTDTITVRVVGNTPEIGDLGGITEDSVSPDGRHTVTIPYDDVKSITVQIIYTDENGNQHVTTLPPKSVDYQEGTATLTFNTLTGEYDLDGVSGTMEEGAYGYGDYSIVVTGEGASGEIVGPSSVDFSTEPVGDGTKIVKEGGTSEEDPERYYLEIDYDNTPGGEIPGGEHVDHIVVRIYDENGNEVSISPLTVNSPVNRVEIPFGLLDEGTYTIKATAYDANGDVIGNDPAISLQYTYKKGGGGDEPLPVPGTGDTGGVMGSLNISKTDYIITGLIIFGIIGVSAAVFISKHDKKAGSRRK